MSAFMLSIEHIRALVNAGLNLTYGPLEWKRVRPTQEQRARSHERGEPWGLEAFPTMQADTASLTPYTADTVGIMLMAQNRRSVDYRYAETDIEDFYTHAPSTQRSVVELLCAIDCYEYQSCETPDWEDTEAFHFCDALRRALIREFPGWHEAPWGITAP